MKIYKLNSSKVLNPVQNKVDIRPNKSTLKKLDYDNDQDRIQLYNLPAIKKRAINQLQGVASAIIYDGLVTDEEIKILLSWLENNRLVHDDWPVSFLIQLLDSILEDKVVTDDERKELLQFLSCITSPLSCDWMPKAITDLISTDIQVMFSEKAFIFTGILQFGRRKKAESEVIKKGGKCPSGGYKNWLDYLVVGSVGNDAWKYGKFGTKIEACMNALEKRNSKTAIISEEKFISAVIDNQS